MSVNGLPLRCRTSSTVHRPRLTPWWSSGAEGALDIRQRVIAEEGSLSGQVPARRHARNNNMSVLPSAAAS